MNGKQLKTILSEGYNPPIHKVGGGKLDKKYVHLFEVVGNKLIEVTDAIDKKVICIDESKDVYVDADEDWYEFVGTDGEKYKVYVY